MIVLATITVIAWIYLLFGHGGFWRARERDDGMAAPPAAWPNVVAVVPARNEAAVIGPAIASLIAQDYPGRFHILLVDDGSDDDTANIARETAALHDAARFDIVTGSAPPHGWTGKLWALAQGAAHAPTDAPWLWFTDADIHHAPDTLRSLVARAEADGLMLNSLMAKLRCTSLAERALIPAFIFFFQMLYPFAQVNRQSASSAAAAGGCMLVRRDALDRAGGLRTMASAIIDDCAMGAALKTQGPIRLSLTQRSSSIRPYGDWREIGAMIARSAYAQLGYSPLLLIGALAGMTLLFLAPPAIALSASGMTQALGLMAWAMMAIAFQPILHFYRRSPLWGIALPAIAAFYTAATFVSALHHWQGRGGMWKGRAQAQLQP